MPDGTAVRLMLVSLLLLSSLAGCRREAPVPDEARYEIKGTVVSVDKSAGQITLSHDAIPGYMDAMTMPFNVRDRWALDAAAPGDTVRAALVVGGGRSWLEGLNVSKANGRSPDPDPNGVVESAASGEPVPSLAFTNQSGHTVDPSRFSGKALLLTFVFTRCPLPDYCPLMSENFVAVSNALRADPGAYGKTHLLSITLDPEYDTPEVLREYGSRYAKAANDDRFEHWDFATGSADATAKLAAFFGLLYRTEDGQIVHSLRTAIVSPDGRVLRVYRGNSWSPADVARDLAAASRGEKLPGESADESVPPPRPSDAKP